MITTNYTAAEIVQAFLSANNTRGYGARSYAKNDTETVYFTCPTALMDITYDCFDGAFYVKFKKFQGAWGDYVRAICNAAHYILKTLQAGGLAVNAPDDPKALEVVCTPGDLGYTKVTWKPI